MVYKLRKAMGKRDDSYTLEGIIEASQQDHKTQKADRGSKIKSNEMIMAESTVLEDLETGKTEKHAR